jgi:hypothetical protein
MGLQRGVGADSPQAVKRRLTMIAPSATLR